MNANEAIQHVVAFIKACKTGDAASIDGDKVKEAFQATQQFSQEEKERLMATLKQDSTSEELRLMFSILTTEAKALAMASGPQEVLIKHPILPAIHLLTTGLSFGQLERRVANDFNLDITDYPAYLCYFLTPDSTPIALREDNLFVMLTAPEITAQPRLILYAVPDITTVDWKAYK